MAAKIILFCSLFMLLILTACFPQGQLTGGTTVDTTIDTAVAKASVSTLTIVVKTEQGELLPEAKIYVNGEYVGKTSKYGESKGTQTVLLNRLENRIQVRKEGYGDSLPVEVSASDQGQQRVTIILDVKKSHFIVSVEDHGQPVDGARVSLFVGKASTPSYVAFTDEQGDALFEDVLDNKYTVTVAQEGYELLRLPQKINVAEAGEYDSITAELQPVPELSVEVADYQGSPLRQAEVLVYTKDAYNSPGEAMPISTDYTDREGLARFTAVEYGEMYVVVVKKQDYLAQTKELQLEPDVHAVRVEMVWNID